MKNMSVFMTVEKGRKVICLKIIRALYDCTQSALLWYNTFVNELSKEGFALNIYDPYVANKDINRSQCVIY